MNSPHATISEYLGQAPAWIDPLIAQSSLHKLLDFIAVDFLPELQAQVAFANDWLAERPEIAAGSNGLPRPGDRSIGMASFTWRGVPAKVIVMPYRLFMLQRVQDAAAQLDASQSKDLQALLAQCGLMDLLTLRCSRRVERQGQSEVWGSYRHHHEVI
jgi:hypothetical protein